MFLIKKFQHVYPFMKDIYSIGEASSAQKKTFSTSEHEMSSISLWIIFNFYPPGSRSSRPKSMRFKLTGSRYRLPHRRRKFLNRIILPLWEKILNGKILCVKPNCIHSCVIEVKLPVHIGASGSDLLPGSDNSAKTGAGQSSLSCCHHPAWLI